LDKTLNGISLECFAYPWEDRESVLQAMLFIIGKKDAKIAADDVESYFGPNITKISFSTEKSAEVRAIFSNLVGLLSEKDRETLIKEMDDRIDNHGNFYMRFSKQDAFLERLALHYEGDVIKVVVKSTSYPFSKKKVTDNLVNALEGL
jgi:hypothetical protein